MAGRILRRVGVALAASVVVVLGAPLAVDAVATDRPVVGLRLADLARSEVWSDGAAAARAVADQRAATTRTLTAGSATHDPTLATLGLVDPADELHDRLLAAGRDGSFWDDLVTQTRAVWGLEEVIPPRDRLDPDRLEAALTSLADEVTAAPTDASIAYAAGRVVVRPDVPGRRLDVDAAVEAVTAAVRDDAPSVDLPTAPVAAAVTSADLTAAAATVGTAVERPLVLAAGDTRSTVAPDAVFAALPVTVAGGVASVGVDAAGLGADIDAVAALTDRQPALRIVMTGTVVAPGAEGARLDRAAASQAVLAELQARAAGGGSDVVTLPVTALPFTTVEATPGAFEGDQAVHLTFDDGPGGHTEQILDILRAKGAHATFYVVGDRAREHPDTVRRILAEGHRLGNHSTTHADLTKATPEALASELATTQQLLTDITGVRPTAFRPPYGAVDAAVRAAAAAEHLSVDLWTVDPNDWRNPGGATVRDRVLAAAKPGDVVLLHVLNQSTVDALPGLIDALRAGGRPVD
ncbi:polysaccharide deacetylase family protein [Xylanimonas protaetiae]|uniref:NodB homology domain-containing protein n=1 Tax=Xylanimonas protaetiae TaxID=2509457 RepID=A0A4P6FBB6_9MICO|nr:polysaccharide deacetylase family protein [Xylanimonas protaetiae]QAY71589.1 hypothetical protein ET471_17415 [Xylanimonas protaetiae]